MVYQTFKQTVENMTEVERNQLAFSIGIIIMCLIGLFIMLIDLYKNKKKLKKVKKEAIKKESKLKKEVFKLIYVDTKVIRYKDENFDENDENFITDTSSSSNINFFPFLPINR